MNKKSVIAAILLIAARPVFAADIWTGWVDMEKLYVTDGGSHFMTSYVHPNVTCDGGKRMYIPSTESNYEIKAAGLMAAFTAQQRVRVVYADPPGATCQLIVNRYQVLAE